MKVPKKSKVKALEVVAAPVRAPVGKPKATKKAPKAAAVGSTIGSALGSLLPPPFNTLASPLLGQLGDWAGDAVGTFLGTGDYEVNSLIDSAQGKTPVRNNGISYVHSQNDEVVFTRREYIGDVISSSTPGAFSIRRFRVQACNSDLFRYLSGIARLHQQWEPRGIVFQFKSNTGLISSAATPNVGVVVMAMEYDASVVAPFADKVQMENSWGGSSVATTEHMAFGVECKYNKNVLNNLYCDNDPLNDRDSAPSMYDLGTFCVATVGQPAASQNCGELWVSYDIVLSKPKLERETFGDPRAGQWRMNIAAAGLSASGVQFLNDDADLFDPTYCLASPDNDFTLSVQTPVGLNPSQFTAGSLLHFPNMSPGTYLISISQGLAGTGTAANTYPAPLTDKCSIGPLFISSPGGAAGLIGGQPALALAFSTPQNAGAMYGNLQSTIFAMEVVDTGPTVTFFGLLPRQAAWTWVTVVSIPPFMLGLSFSRNFMEKGFRVPFPEETDPLTPIYMTRSGVRGAAPTLTLGEPVKTAVKKNRLEKEEQTLTSASVTMPDGTTLGIVKQPSGWAVIPGL